MITALIRVSPLNRSFSRTGFDCGNTELNTFLQNNALRNQEQNINRTCVAHEENSKLILGFHTLCNASISVDTLPQDMAKKLPRYPVPCILLARLGVDRSYQGEGIGRILLRDAIEKVKYVCNISGVYAMIVDAKDDPARNFYKHYGFLCLKDPDRPYTLFLPVSTFI